MRKAMVAVVLLGLGAQTSWAQLGTAFTYQGRLADGALPANGTYDFEFQLFTASTGGTGSSVQTLGDVTVATGLFAVKLDFGAVFTGSPRWLEIRVRPGVSTGAYTTLTPRQELTPAPNAMFATSAGTVAANGVNTAQIADGAITALKLGTGAVTSGTIASGQVVKSLNGAQDSVTIVGSGGATVSTVGSAITVSAAPPAPPLPSGAVVLGTSGDTTLIGAGYSELPVGRQELWGATAITAGVPSGRTNHTAVWTGSRMIVWGGNVSAASTNTGGLYDPLGNSWTPTAVMLGVPSAREFHTAVWTGSKMIIWGGFANPTYLNTGGQYDPEGDSWTATAITPGVPSERSSHTAVWTGSKMIVWGGGVSGTNVNTGAQYDPLGDAWTTTAITPGVPSGRSSHAAVWTGSRMIVWGGSGLSAYTNTGGQWFELSYFIKN